MKVWNINIWAIFGLSAKFGILLLGLLYINVCSFAAENTILSNPSIENGNAGSEGNTFFKLSGSTCFIISNETNVVIKGNVVLKDDLKGDGSVILDSRDKVKLDGNNQTINNLNIRGNTKVELTGNLKIEESLTITSGILFLGNFNLFLMPDAKTNEFALDNIIEDGLGRLIIDDGNTEYVHFPYDTVQHPNSSMAAICVGFSLEVSLPYQDYVKPYVNNLYYAFIGTYVPPPKIFIN